MRKLLAVLAALVVLASPARAQITIPNTLVAGTTIRAADLNTNFSTLGNGALNRLTGGNVSGNITLDPGITVDGVDIGATLCPTCAPTFKDLTLSTPTTGITVNAVNIVNSAGKIPALTSTYFASLTFDGANITTGTVPSANGGVPSGLVAFSTAGSCPTGWTEYTSARGRYIVGLPLSGTNLAAVGTALTDQENRAVGLHNHTGTVSVSLNDPGHTHTVPNSVTVIGGGGSSVENAGTAGSYLAGEATSSATTGITVSSATTSIANAGSVAGTNAPYIQLIACQKS